MSLSDHAVRLAGLHEHPAFAAARFDTGVAFAGRVAVLPSAFNPPTLAHVGLLELGQTVDGVVRVAAMLTTNNVDKSLFGAPLSHRVGMLLAIHAERPAIAVLGSNAARLMDQGLALEIAFPGIGFDFIVGFDTLVRLFDRKYYEDMDAALTEFFSRHRVIATNRAEATTAAVRDYLREPVVERYAERIVVRELDHERAFLSSTAAREVGGRPGQAEALTPGVREYIEKHGLYAAHD